MLITKLSDIHLEHFWNIDDGIAYLNRIRPVETADVLLLAGDIWELNSQAKYRYLDEFRKWAVELIYVPGNHDYYNCNPDIVGRDTLKALEREGLRVLGPEFRTSFIYQDIKFVGTTCWYPDNEKVRLQLRNWSDRAYIKNFVRWWELHQLEERKMLWKELEPGCIVVTHMLPTWECIDPKWATDPCNCLYVADLKDLVEERKPSIWFHGHSHEPLDITIQDTRFIRNPIGYPGYINPDTIKILELNI